MLIRLTQDIKEALISRGVESFHVSDFTNISDQAIFEPPCGIKWAGIEGEFSIGAFSYVVSGFCSAVNIGRYTSIGEQVQLGRANHALNWVSTSPFFYLRERIFAVGEEFEGSAAYGSYIAPVREEEATAFRPITLGNDVWVGHGAFILPGVTVGDGAIIGAMSVVTKDVPAYGVVAGNPATLRRMRMPEAQAEELARIKWWRFAPWQLAHVDFSSPERAVGKLELLEEESSPYTPAPVKMKDIIALA